MSAYSYSPSRPAGSRGSVFSIYRGDSNEITRTPKRHSSGSHNNNRTGRTSLPPSSILAPSTKANKSPLVRSRTGAPPLYNQYNRGSLEKSRSPRVPSHPMSSSEKRRPTSNTSLGVRGQYRSSRIQAPSARKSVSPLPGTKYSSSASVGGSVGGAYNAHSTEDSSILSSGTFRNSTAGDGQAVDDAAVVEFAMAIQSLAPDDWRARTLALERLVNSVPEDSNAPTEGAENNIMPWYKSPVVLRRLNNPVSSLLLDPRSTVVKHATQHFVVLVERVCANDKNVVRHLMKDLLPTIMGLHGQTVNIIRGYATSMMLEIIPLARFKLGLPTIIDRLKRDKSRDVREAAARYLRAIVESWAEEAAVVSSVSDIGGVNDGDENKTSRLTLTKDIATHIGTGLARALMDPSQCVRMEARLGFESFRVRFPRIWHDIVYKDDGVLSKDAKLKKSVINAAIRADAERSLRHIDGSAGDDRSLGTYDRNHEEEDAVSVLSFDSRGNSTVRTFESAGAASHGTGRAGSVLVGSRRRERGGYSKSPVGGVGGGPGNRGGYHNRRQNLTNGTGSATSAISSSRNSSDISGVGSTIRGQLQSPGTSSDSIGATRAPLETSPQNDEWLQGASETEVRRRAAESIQAALRGAFVRKELLPESTVADVADPTSSRLGTTAATMAERRRTLGALAAKQVSPAPVTPGAGSIGSISSPVTPLDDPSFASPDGSTRVMTPKQRLFASYNAGRKSSQQSDQASPSKVFSPGSIADESGEEGSAQATPRMTAGESRNGGPSAPQTKKTTPQLLRMLRQRFENEQKPSNFSSAGQTLLDLHKEHINTLMEVLRAEMDVVAEFERLVSSSEAIVQPSEEDVLDYFEAVAVCLDKRTEGGEALRHSMERICSGNGNIE